MRVLDPGHLYRLDFLDGNNEFYPDSNLRFVKRLGPKYPGNTRFSYPGTTCQEVLRVLIDRVKYLDRQQPSNFNTAILAELRAALINFEVRAAEGHGRLLPVLPEDVENLPTCTKCGHIYCNCKLKDVRYGQEP